MFEGSPTIEKREKHGKTNGSKGNLLSVHSLCGSAAPSKLLVLFLYKSCEKRWFPGKFWIWALVAAFSSVWDVYWCNHIQALTFRAGSRTPSLDSKMCQFPRISLSELWKVSSFSPFCVGFLSTTVQCRLWLQFCSKTNLASFVQAKICFFKPKSAIGKWLKKDMWMK